MRINVLQGHGCQTGGAGAVANNFRNWCLGLGHDVIMYHNVATAEERRGRSFAMGWEKQATDEVIKFTDQDFKPRPSDLTVVFTLCDEQAMVHNPDKAPEIYEGLVRFLEESKKTGSRLLFVNITHVMYKGMRVFIGEHLDLWADVFDSMITFGPGDAMVHQFEKTDKATTDSKIVPKMNYLSHNTLWKPEKNWLPYSEKKHQQLYWQGRSLRCKGWTNWFDLKERLAAHGCKKNFLMNGLPASIGTIQVICDSTKPKVFKPFVDYTPVTKTPIQFSDEIEDKTRIYGEYKYADGFKLMQQAEYGLYTTKMTRDFGFFPEYATIDALEAGTVLAMPHWYWLGLDADRGFLEGMPGDYGSIALPADDDDVDRFAADMDRLTGDEEAYDAARELAWQRYVLDRDDAGIVDKMLKIGLGDLVNYSEKPWYEAPGASKPKGLLALL